MFKSFLTSSRSGLPPGAVKDIVERLFAIFDRDGNGVVDSRELLAGLSIMCKGDGADRIRAAFEMFAENGDGVISLQVRARARVCVRVCVWVCGCVGVCVCAWVS